MARPRVSEGVTRILQMEAFTGNACVSRSPQHSSCSRVCVCVCVMVLSFSPSLVLSLNPPYLWHCCFQTPESCVRVPLRLALFPCVCVCVCVCVSVTVHSSNPSSEPAAAGGHAVANRRITCLHCIEGALPVRLTGKALLGIELS